MHGFAAAIASPPDPSPSVTRLTSFGAVHEQAMELASKVQGNGHSVHRYTSPDHSYTNPGLEECSSSSMSSYRSSKNSTLSSDISLAVIQANLQSALAARRNQSGLSTVREDTDSEPDLPPPPVPHFNGGSSGLDSETSSTLRSNICTVYIG